MKTKLPLQDGDKFVDCRGRTQLVEGEITDPGAESVCYTRRGNWFRRKDAVEVTGTWRDDAGNPVTISEALNMSRSELHRSPRQ